MSPDIMRILFMDIIHDIIHDCLANKKRGTGYSPNPFFYYTAYRQAMLANCSIDDVSYDNSSRSSFVAIYLITIFEVSPIASLT